MRRSTNSVPMKIQLNSRAEPSTSTATSRKAEQGRSGAHKQAQDFAQARRAEPGLEEKRLFSEYGLDVENEQADAGRDGTGRPNLTRETKLSGANEDRENSFFPVQLTTSRKKWQSCPVDVQSAESDDHTQTTKRNTDLELREEILRIGSSRVKQYGSCIRNGSPSAISICGITVRLLSRSEIETTLRRFHQLGAHRAEEGNTQASRSSFSEETWRRVALLIVIAGALPNFGYLCTTSLVFALQIGNTSEYCIAFHQLEESSSFPSSPESLIGSRNPACAPDDVPLQELREGQRPVETSAAEEDRTSRLEVDVTAMALMGEEQPVTTEVAAVTASAENDGDKPAARRSSSSQQLHVPSDGSLNGAHSEASSNVRKNASQGQGARTAAGPTIVSALSTPSLPTKRTVRELLETRNTPSKMEIGQGVMLLADISGAELVVIRGLFQGSIKAQCIDVEQGAEVQGNVECEAARIDGKFDGVFVSTHSLHLASHADVSGRIVYRRLKVAKGAQIYGHSEYRSPVLSK